MLQAKISIIDMQCSNLASVRAAFERLGAETELVRDAAAVSSAERLVLPGVGAFARGMDRLRELGLEDALRARCAEGRSLLAICLGLQLLCRSSAEAPGVDGLGVVDAKVEALDAPDLPLPQLGWNRVRAASRSEASALEPERWAFFANGYGVRGEPEGWEVATSRYGPDFVAAMRRASVLACQFHPELSGDYGRELLQSWLAQDLVPARRGPALRVIPCLDLDGGRVVKGVRFSNLRDAGSPLERAVLYEEQGADELVLLDVSATLEARAHATAVVGELRARLALPLTVGGGVRSEDDAARLLDAGADKVAINSAAVERPEIVAELAERFGSQCVVVSIDAARRELGGVAKAAWEVRTRSGSHASGLDAVAWAARVAELGAGEILVTSHDRDGTKSGYDCALLRAIRAACALPLVASGGASSAQDMVEAVEAGASAVLAASIFHDGERSVASVKQELMRAGLELRP